MGKADRQSGSMLIPVVLGIAIVLVAALWGGSFFLAGYSQTNESGFIAAEETSEYALKLEQQVQVSEYKLEGRSLDVDLAAPAAVWPEQNSSGGSAGGTVSLQNGTDYILPESNIRYYTEAELTGLSKQQLSIARNEIYARLGRKFKDESLRTYFEGKSWYQPIYEPKVFDAKGDGMFNEYELANRNLIVKIEAKKN